MVSNFAPLLGAGLAQRTLPFRPWAGDDRVTEKLRASAGLDPA
jgi:hypothetical protein